MSDRAYAFIDGASFEPTIELILKDFDCLLDQIDWHSLTKGAARIFYFDALPVKKNSESDDAFNKNLRTKTEQFSHFRRIPNMHVREGVTRSQRRSRAPELTQKGVDIALTVEVLTHTFRDTIDTARIFASDLDFFPLLDALTSTKVKSELFYGPAITSMELIESADISFPVDHYSVHAALPVDKKSYYGITGHSEEISDYERIETGDGTYGPVEILKSPRTDNFVLNGNVDPINRYSHMSRSKNLLVCHFDACSKSKTRWKTKN